MHLAINSVPLWPSSYGRSLQPPWLCLLSFVVISCVPFLPRYKPSDPPEMMAACSTLLCGGLPEIPFHISQWWTRMIRSSHNPKGLFRNGHVLFNRKLLKKKDGWLVDAGTNATSKDWGGSTFKIQPEFLSLCVTAGDTIISSANYVAIARSSQLFLTRRNFFSIWKPLSELQKSLNIKVSLK